MILYNDLVSARVCEDAALHWQQAERYIWGLVSEISRRIARPWRRVQGNERDTSHLQDPSIASVIDSVQAEVQHLQKENEELLTSLKRVSFRRRSEAEQLLEEQIHEDLQAELVESQELSCALEGVPS